MNTPIDIKFTLDQKKGLGVLHEDRDGLKYYKLKSEVANWLNDNIVYSKNWIGPPKYNVRRELGFGSECVYIWFLFKEDAIKFCDRWFWFPVTEKAMATNDPFFKEDDIVIVLDQRDDLTDPDKACLKPELFEWMIQNAPFTQWTYRRTEGTKPKLRVVFKFTKESYAIHFKLRWYTPS